MKTLSIVKIKILLIPALMFGGINVLAQDSVKTEPVVKLSYYVSDNTFPYLMVKSQNKLGKKYKPLPKQSVAIFLDSAGNENLISKTFTDETGKAKVALPAVLRDKWNNRSKHSFMAIMKSTSSEDITTTLDITKSKISIDTTTIDGAKKIEVKVMYLENNSWLPAKDVEMKIGVNRLGGILSAGDEETYTTDSTGTATAEFKRDSLPGDNKGNIVLAARVEDNDSYGNLFVQKTVPWGTATTSQKDFFEQRTLWSTRFRTPIWLLLMAYSIVVSVWSTLIYLVFQIAKIKKLGTAG